MDVDNFFDACRPLKKGSAMFSNNEKVVYPGHGVAVVERIVERKVAGNNAKFFQLRFINKDMMILVPVNSTNKIGIRPLSTNDSIEHVFKFLSSPLDIKIKDPNGSNWNKRNKEYQLRLMSGNLDGICEIYRELKSIEMLKDLSFGEKGLLAKTESLLVEEIVFVSGEKPESILKKIKSLVSVMTKKASHIVTQKQL